MRWLVFLAALLSSSALNAQSAGDHLLGCAVTTSNPTFCASSRKQFTEEFPQALKGDYQSQRNVAYCLTYGCDGAVAVNATLGCAWRVVIQASGSSRVDPTDTSAFQRACGRLSELELATASEQAQVLFRKIYKRQLPVQFR